MSIVLLIASSSTSLPGIVKVRNVVSVSLGSPQLASRNAAFDTSDNYASSALSRMYQDSRERRMIVSLIEADRE